MSKNKLGQYFTTNQTLKEKVFDFILNGPQNILEPSIGQGDLVNFIISKIPNITFDMYEIDKSIKLLPEINKKQVIYEDFLIQTINKKYKTIIGNPPYIRTKKGNLYIDFIEKCYNLLDDCGELIFIIPSDFFKLTSSVKLLNIMFNNGVFTHIYHPNNEKLFENASIDIIIFRYCKNILLEKKTLYNEKVMDIININGSITFKEPGKNDNNNNIFQDYFDIYVGMVSAKDDIYKNENLGNIAILNGLNKVEKYIYIDKYPCGNEDIDKYLLENKEILKKRKIRKFNDNNWFEWGAARNIDKIKNNLGKDCIYVYNLTRKQQIAFVSKVQYFGGSLILLIPKQSEPNGNQNINLNEVVSYLNSDKFKNNFMFSGRFKIGHRSLANSTIKDIV
ncbi:DNA methyltransferase [Hokovirus HKV1]|uniref:site-specific DNA-methyltransferase (adenine-specific) n=1 Tax=Hokovirus HKV1 TaxID=1977638 RepID=A0A1V0SF64_9VIRU|nr:DNA methyltransferase [Hokovirus HKV1]